MPAEDAGRSELTELVSYQVLRDIYRNPCLSIVNGDRLSNHLRDDRRATRVGLDHLLLTSLVGFHDPLKKFLFNKRTFLD